MLRKSVLGGIVALSAMSAFASVALAAETGTGSATTTAAPKAPPAPTPTDKAPPELTGNAAAESATNSTSTAESVDNSDWRRPRDESDLRSEALGMAVSMEHHKTERTHSAHVVGNAEAFLKFLKGDTDA